MENNVPFLSRLCRVSQTACHKFAADTEHHWLRTQSCRMAEGGGPRSDEFTNDHILGKMQMVVHYVNNYFQFFEILNIMCTNVVMRILKVN